MTARSIFTLSILNAQLCFGVTIHVDSNANGSENGSSWTNAYTTLQAALASANAGDEIWIAQGVYYPDEGPGQLENARSSTFSLVEGVSIYGGFAGDEVNLNERDIEANATVFSGDLAQNDGPDFKNNSDNAYHVIRADETITQATIIDGVQITAGNADLNGIFPDQTGGGAYIFTGAPSFIDCTFHGNAAEFGGAVLVDNANPTFTDCIFENNLGEFGGAIYVYNMSSPVFERITVTGNDAELGGGIYSTQSTPTIINSIFRGNTATLGGAAYDSNEAAPEYTNCIFQGNSAELGGAFYCNTTSTGAVINCSIQGNLASVEGGGVYNNLDATPVFTNCIVWNNAADGETDTLSASLFNNGTLAGFNFSLVENWTIENLLGTGNFNGAEALNDPRFVDPIDPLTAPSLNGDLNLQDGTPVSGSGDNAANLEPTDLAGNARIQNTVIDLGPYEYNFDTTFETRYPALQPEDDENGNGLSNFLEYALGLDPTVDNTLTDYNQVISGTQLSYRVRAVGNDVSVDFEKSSDLSNWSDMILGVDYNLIDETISGVQKTVTVDLLTQDTEPVLFFRQVF